jgi:hypothetical protein
LFEPLPRLIEVVTEDGSYSSSFRFLFFFSRARMGAAGAYECWYPREGFVRVRGDTTTHLLIHTYNRIRSLLRFQQVVRELNQIGLTLSVSYLPIDRRIWGGGFTDQGKPSTLHLIVLQFISVVIFETPSPGLLIVESARIFGER